MINNNNNNNPNTVATAVHGPTSPFGTQYGFLDRRGAAESECGTRGTRVARSAVRPIDSITAAAATPGPSSSSPPTTYGHRRRAAKTGVCVCTSTTPSRYRPFPFASSAPPSPFPTQASVATLIYGGHSAVRVRRRTSTAGVCAFPAAAPKGPGPNLT